MGSDKSLPRMRLSTGEALGTPKPCTISTSSRVVGVPALAASSLASTSTNSGKSSLCGSSSAAALRSSACCLARIISGEVPAPTADIASCAARSCSKGAIPSVGIACPSGVTLVTGAGSAKGSASSAASAGASSVSAANSSRRLRAAARPVTLPIGPSVPPIVAARYAASPYSAIASSDNTSRPACALSRTCCATSVGISAAAPVVTPRPTVRPKLRFAVVINFSASAFDAARATSSAPLPRIGAMTPLPNIKYCPISSGTACRAAVPTALPVSISTGRPSAISASA